MGFSRDFDEGLLQRMSEVSFEDDPKDIPSPPDVSNYLVSEVLCSFFSLFSFLLICLAFVKIWSCSQLFVALVLYPGNIEISLSAGILPLQVLNIVVCRMMSLVLMETKNQFVLMGWQMRRLKEGLR